MSWKFWAGTTVFLFGLWVFAIYTVVTDLSEGTVNHLYMVLMVVTTIAASLSLIKTTAGYYNEGRKEKDR